MDSRRGKAQSNFLPSPSIWGDGTGYEAVDQGIGYNAVVDFKGGLSTGPVIYAYTATSTVTAYDANFDSVLQFSTCSTGLSQAQLYTRPLGVPGLNSQNKLKMEAIIGFNSSTISTGVFVGFGNLPSLSTYVDATPSTLVNNSLVGFFLKGNTASTATTAGSTGFDAIYQNSTGGTSTVLANVLYATAFTTSSTQFQLQGAQTGTGAATPTAPGSTVVVNSGGTALNSTGSTFIKLGVTYDGINTWYYWVNGVQVAKLNGTGLTDNTSSYGAVVGLAANGSSTVLDVAYLRAAYAPAN